MFNISGTFLFIWFVGPFAQFIQMISPKGPEIEVISRQIANAHTVFNCVMTLIWVPLIWLMVKIVMRIIPDGRKEQYSLSEPLYLDEKLIGQPTAALQLVAKEVLHCSEIVRDMIRQTREALKNEEKKEIEDVHCKLDAVKSLHARITQYLTDLFASGSLNEEQASQSAGIMYVLSDVDRMGILCGEVAGGIKEKMEKKYKYSKEAMKDLGKSLELIETMYSEVLEAIVSGKLEHAKELVKTREKIMELDISM